MARIPQETIDRLKREVSIAELARGRGIQLERHGEDNLMARCPWHDDSTPSLCISPSKNLWNCLGACQQGGDVIQWVMKMENVAFRRAVEILLGSTGPEEVLVKKRSALHLPEIDLGGDDHTLKARVTRYYAERLHAPDSPEGLAYLERRGIRNDELIERFRIGFADRTLGPRIPTKDYKAGREMRGALERTGLWRQETAREHFNGCVTFPILSESGEVEQVYGRKIRDDVRFRHGSHLYLPGPQRGVWNRGGIAAGEGTVIVCEAVIDAATFWCAGFRNVTTAYGVNGFTSELLDALKANHVTRVLIAYDRDEAGDKAAGHLALSLGREGMGVFRVVFPRLMDANDYARKVTPAAQSLGVLLKAAEWMGGPKQRTMLTLPAAVVDHDEAPPAPAIVPAPAVETKTREEGNDVPPVEPAPTSEPLFSLAAPSAPAAPEPPAEPDRKLAVSDCSTIDLSFGDRRYRIRGLEKCMSFQQMKIVLRAARGELVFLDQLDLVSARHRAGYVKQAAIDLGLKEDVIKRDIASVYRQLEQVQEEMIRKTLEPKAARPAMSEEDLRAAMELCRDPRMFDRILGDYERCGVIGERVNKLVAHLASVSRLLDDPVAIIVQSSSAAGKTKLMDAVLDLVPEEDRVRYSAVTGQSLFYFKDSNLKHKILAISEEEGAERAVYALKLLQSEGQLTIASTGKNPTTGRLETQEYRVEGPVMIFLTTTAIEIDEELLNRCIVLTVDENREQTRAIHKLQRAAETLEGMIAKEEKQQILRLHRNAQRLLRPIRVVNPHATKLRFPDSSTRMRRDHMKYLALIRSITLARQHQREHKIHQHSSGPLEYIEVTAEDIALANELAHEVLGRSLDELSPQTRRLLEILDSNVARECARRAMARCDLRFTQRQVREWSGWSDYQVKSHLQRLVAMEYLLIHRGGRGQSFVYELLYDGKGRDGRKFFLGLIDVGAPNQEHPKAGWEEPGSIQGGIGEHPGSEAQNRANLNPSTALPKTRVKTFKKTHRSGNGKDHVVGRESS